MRPEKRKERKEKSLRAKGRDPRRENIERATAVKTMSKTSRYAIAERNRRTEQDTELAAPPGNKSEAAKAAQREAPVTRQRQHVQQAAAGKGSLRQHADTSSGSSSGSKQQRRRKGSSKSEAKGNSGARGPSHLAEKGTSVSGTTSPEPHSVHPHTAKPSGAGTPRSPAAKKEEKEKEEAAEEKAQED